MRKEKQKMRKMYQEPHIEVSHIEPEVLMYELGTASLPGHMAPARHMGGGKPEVF